MSKTGTQLVTSIKDNLGGRASGTIGVRAIDDVIIDKVNDTIRQILRRYALPCCKRRATVSVTTADFIYALPTTDVDSNVITVRTLFGMYGVCNTTDRWVIERASHTTKLAEFPLTSSSLSTGRPLRYTVFGSNFYLHPFPSENFTAHIWCSVWPAAITIAQTQPLATEYDDIIEAGATSLVYAALQRPDDYAAWRLIFNGRMKEQLFIEREKPDWNPLESSLDSADPQNDPFVKTDTQAHSY